VDAKQATDNGATEKEPAGSTPDSEGVVTSGAPLIAELRQVTSHEAVTAILTRYAPPTARFSAQALRGEIMEALKAADVKGIAGLVDAWLARAPRTEQEDDLQGQTLDVSDPEPYPLPVDGRELLEEIAALLNNYAIMPDGGYVTTSLWIVYTHAFDVFDISPYLAINSPVMRCGKSTVAEFIKATSLRGILASNITAASMFRAVEAWHPTLIADEADTWMFKERSELRGIVNSGNKRDSAYVIRAVGEDYEPRQFSTWSPKVIAGIGKLPDTVMDRSIVLTMRRKLPEERTRPWRPTRDADLRWRLAQIRSKAFRWAFDHQEELRHARPQRVPALHDRAQDNWEPLLAIADLVGERWPVDARRAAELLTSQVTDETTGLLLLADIREAFAETGEVELKTDYLLWRLNAMEHRPWPTWRRGRPLTGKSLSNQLTPFDIHPAKMSDGTARGYRLDDNMLDAFRRYLQETESKDVQS
jgi:putative DNA primase/helicase